MSRERGLQQKADINQRQWENAEFPILCEGCLGDNPYVRMIVDHFNGTCKMCDRPFTVFKWKPGRSEGYRKTEVCQSCARTKNLCQTCILDMQLGLPSQLRDAVLSHSDDGLAAPTSIINREYITQQQLVRLNAEGDEVLANETSERLLKIARAVATDRAQPRVKMFQSSKVPDAPVSDDRKRSHSEIDEDSSENVEQVIFPPGIESMEQLQRLPASMQSFLKKQYGIVTPNSDDSNFGKSNEEPLASKPKKQKIKYFPKPPSGPPPPGALVEPKENN